MANNSITASAGSVSVIRDQLRYGMRRLTLEWTSNGSGTATISGIDLIGLLRRMVTNPDDTDAPTDNYDITLEDVDGVDVLQGAGADRDTATSEDIGPEIEDNATPNAYQPVAVFGQHTLKVTNAGDTKKGRVTFYLQTTEDY